MSLKIKPWIEAMRLRTLPVSVAGVVTGCGLAAFYESFSIVPAAICLLFAVLAQIASNFANEYYDFKGGFDKKGREGFRRGVTEGDITPGAMLRATYLTLALAALTGLSLLIYGGWWLLPAGVAIAIFALAYSAGPYPLSHHGLGDIAVIVFFGLVPVTLTCYVQTGPDAFSPMVLCIALAIGLMAANVLIVNNYRDMDDDLSVGKRTTVVIFGRRAMALVYLLFFFIAIALCIAVTWPFFAPGWWMIYNLGAVVAVVLYQRLIKKRGAALNAQLGMTAMTLLAFSTALAIALACSRI